MPNEIKQPSSPRAQENEFEQILEFVVEQIAQRFENQVLKELNRSTVEKFADAQTGNFAKVLLSLSNKVQRKIRRQFNNERIEAMVSDILRKVDKRQQQQLYNQIENAIGINTKRLISREGLTPQINALIAETAQWVKKLRDESLEKFTNNTLHAMTMGQNLGDLMEQFRNVKEERKGHAKFLAHNQIQNFNSVTTKLRSQKLGVKRAIWDTADDDTVRPSHADRDGREFDLSEGLYSSVDGKYLIPGVDYNCRCTMRLLLDEEDEL
jgi:SPP1 gp7 family putative phage head morphogenesis protein